MARKGQVWLTSAELECINISRPPRRALEPVGNMRHLGWRIHSRLRLGSVTLRSNRFRGSPVIRCNAALTGQDPSVPAIFHWTRLRIA